MAKKRMAVLQINETDVELLETILESFRLEFHGVEDKIPEIYFSNKLSDRITIIKSGWSKKAK